MTEERNSMLIGQLLFSDDARQTGGCLALIGQLREALSFLEVRYAALVARQRLSDTAGEVAALADSKTAQRAAQPAAKRGRKPAADKINGHGHGDRPLPLEAPAAAAEG